MASVRSWVLRRLVIPAALVVAYASARWLTAGGASTSVVDSVTPLSAKMLAFAGCWAAAFSFRRGDYLRVAWLVYGVTYPLLAVASLMYVFPEARWYTIPGIVLYAIGNIANGVGAFLLARTWLVAGIGLPGSPWTR